MKRLFLISMLLLGSIFSGNTVAQEWDSLPHQLPEESTREIFSETPILDENLPGSIQIDEHWLTPLTDLMLTVQEARTAIIEAGGTPYTKSISQSMQTDVVSSTSPLLSREFGVYLVLQELGINLSQFDQPSLGSGFTDVPEDSFFAPYITFARDVGMVRGYAEGAFRPKHLMSREEFDNILHYATKSHKSHLQHTYRTMREKHLDFSAAPEHSTENNETTIPLAVAHELADSIIPFDPSFLYESATRDDTLYPIILPDNTVHFLISSLSGYTLFFDYDGIPFLSPATRVFSLDEIQNHMLDAVNQYRETHTLKAVELNTKLNDVAQTYAKKLFDTRHFDHEDQDGLTVADRVIDQDYHYIRVLENLGKGQRSIEAVMEEWKQSPSHNKNLLDAEVDEMGIGFYGNYWVQVFGKEMP